LKITVIDSLDNEEFQIHCDITLSEISISALSEKQSTNITNDNTDSRYGLYVGVLRDIKKWRQRY
jgi:hypothetical protein